MVQSGQTFGALGLTNRKVVTGGSGQGFFAYDPCGNTAMRASGTSSVSMDFDPGLIMGDSGMALTVHGRSEDLQGLITVCAMVALVLFLQFGLRRVLNYRLQRARFSVF